MRFAKYHADGNSFLIFWENDSPAQFKLTAEWVRRQCDKRVGIGADGLVWLRPGTKSDLQWEFFNDDGQKAEFCGNALRCVGQWAFNTSKVARKFSLDTGFDLIEIEVENSQTEVKMPLPQGFVPYLKLSSLPDSILQTFSEMHFVKMGVPHLLIRVNEKINLSTRQSRLEWQEKARLFRQHSYFGAAGTNVSFFVLNSSAGELFMDTYERGVEDFTLSCGSGLSAMGVIADLVYKLPSPVLLQTQLAWVSVRWEKQIGHIMNRYFLKGSATAVCRGELIEVKKT